ncbi:hypothetical protein [Pseudomethylobacillus aquaticus]|uniref:hypothetical protein n=1 Tax=Pseudomethylobacillus aquaticus TaxID=2676064 RepID=UPI0011CEB7D6|nr:hypothetical protein [Pseudomethylobacillus aquaticus]
MDLFCFASRNVENIKRGIDHQLWAVGTLPNQQSMAGRITKAQRYLRPGAFGVIYCNPLHAFTTPFIIRSHADPAAVVNDVWPESWRLPFKIETLGDMSKLLPAEEAKARWPILQKRLERNSGRGGVSAAMNITGTTVFVPVPITHEDWEIICQDLATK